MVMENNAEILNSSIRLEMSLFQGNKYILEKIIRQLKLTKHKYFKSLWPKEKQRVFFRMKKKALFLISANSSILFS